MDDDWTLESQTRAVFSWRYDDHRAKLIDLYQRGKDRQWDAASRIDWAAPADPADCFGMGDARIPIAGTPLWQALSGDTRRQVRHHYTAWQFSQFLHGEQGATICAARVVEATPTLDAKFYAATQVVDEARHVEVFSRLLREKIGMRYPPEAGLQSLLEETLRESRWDFVYLGMQVLVEGLALGAFGLLRDTVHNRLIKEILSYVMQDEARHVAFGRLALADYYRRVGPAELREREDFVIEGCRALRTRFEAAQVWESLGLDVDECVRTVRESSMLRMFDVWVFSRILPCLRDVGLWTERVQRMFQDSGLVRLARKDLDDMMCRDEAVAERVELDARRLQIADTAGVGDVRNIPPLHPSTYQEVFS
jgi:P-aminobenzoate N-oxygenase AurF